MWVYDPRADTFTDVAVPGSSKILQGINSAGDMVGSIRGAPSGALFQDSDTDLYSFVRSASGSLTFFGTIPLGINNAGFISGGLSDASGIVSRGFVAVNANYGGESGWGINFAHQGDIIFATWFTYDAHGKAWWLAMTATKRAEGIYSGVLYRTNGAPFSEFVPPAMPTAVGTGTITFSSATTGTFSYQVNDGASMASESLKPITRQTFGPVPLCIWGAQPDLTKATNFQDMWWAAPAGSESRWGVNLTQQGTTIFATWFTYDANYNPL